MTIPRNEDFIREGTPHASFADRLEHLHDAKAPDSEIDAAVIVYERLLTAIAICNSAFEGQFTQTAVLEVLSALGSQAHTGTRLEDRE